MRTAVKILSLFIVVASLSCHRQPLEQGCYEDAKIPIAVDWNKSQITPQNVSALFYDENNGGQLVVEHTFEHNAKQIQSYADVPSGRYTVVIFNELRNQIERVNVRGHDRLSTLEFYAVDNPNILARSITNGYVSQPAELGTVIIRGFEVTDDMIRYTRNTSANATETPDVVEATNALVGVVPDNRISQLTITVHVKGLHNSRMPALVELRNVSGSYFADTDLNSTDPTAHQFTMNNRTYDENSSRDGTISTKTAPIMLFGTLGHRNRISDHTADTPILLDMLFMLVDAEKTVINRVVDVTNLITFSPHPNGSTSLNLTVDLTDALPDVKPEGSTDSGFNSDIDEWDGVDITLPSD